MIDLQHLLEAHRKFNSLLRDLALGIKIDTFIQQVVETVEECIPHSFASILHLDPKTQTLHCATKNNLPDFYNQAINGIEIGPEVGSCGAAAFLKEPVIASNINTHPNWQNYLALTQQANLHACWSIPILCSKKKVLGTFAIYHQKPTTPEPEEREILDIAALVVSVAIEKQTLEEQVTYAATHDELTGLYNRNYLNQAGEALLSLSKRKQQPLALLFLDLNKFKLINDNLGHKRGDILLKQIAEEIKLSIRPSDIAVRFGGDEFIILMLLDNIEESTLIAKRIQKNIKNKTNNTILELGFGVSIGIASNTNNYKSTLSKLINMADKAMYYSKKHQLEFSQYEVDTKS
ncbi:sensor domain-containing diguanylate cyclase [Pseudoalteromonas sp. NBT06-2]|uniref:sensor domain-containing diguanylate cyclase n=1 Tax=Pseudoalteromonas sp. NBT06-2 TaxID=2025950 RepID=UPI001482AEAE|nr:sensor domain-containing diguanylate cyclase [Pseudoalteromonas sp. NBT06-2]